MIRLILAAPDLPDEPALLTAISDRGMRVVRRCVDSADLLASAIAEPDASVIVSEGLPRLTREVMEDVCRSGRIVIGLAASDPAALHALGVRSTVPWGQPVAIAEELAGMTGSGAPEGIHHFTRATHDPASDAAGELWAVWGPHGSPGRTSIAIALADSLAGSGRRVALVDADTTSPSVAFALGMGEPSPGVLGACRRADHAALEHDSLLACMRTVHDWPVLVGLDDPAQWRQVRPALLEKVWSSCRSAFDITVVDIGAGIDEPGDDPWASDRDGIARGVLAEADRVLAVAGADALGAARLARSWPGLRELAQGHPVSVVRNKVTRQSPRKWQEAVRRLGVDARILDLGCHAREVQYCWARGRTPREQRGTRAWARAVEALARDLVRD